MLDIYERSKKPLREPHLISITSIHTNMQRLSLSINILFLFSDLACYDVM